MGTHFKILRHNLDGQKTILIRRLKSNLICTGPHHKPARKSRLYSSVKEIYIYTYKKNKKRKRNIFIHYSELLKNPRSQVDGDES